MYLDPTKYGGEYQNHEKMQFAARDIIRVKNPLDGDFRFKYDSVFHTVKAGQTKDFERYLAIHYCDTIAQHIIGIMIGEQGQKSVKQYASMNPQLLLDKYIENRQVWDKMPRLDDVELNAKIWSDCWVGLVEKYGEDREVPEADKPRLQMGSSLQQQLAERFANIKVGDAPMPPHQQQVGFVPQQQQPVQPQPQVQVNPTPQPAPQPQVQVQAQPQVQPQPVMTEPVAPPQSAPAPQSVVQPATAAEVSV